MIVLVCGGRSFERGAVVRAVLDDLHAEYGFTLLVEGGAPGADRLARAWATLAGVKFTTVRADWQKHGKAAGPIRNQEMLDRFRPELVVAFPGGRGTAGMVKLAEKAGVRVLPVVPDAGVVIKSST